MDTLIYSEARNAFADIFDAAIAHAPTRIARRRSGEAVLIGHDDLLALTEPFAFHPAVYFEQDGVSIWLPELELWGRGADFESAREDLIDEIRHYQEEYLADARLRAAPNHRPRAPWLVRAMLLDDTQLAEAMFAEPAEPR
ncbi:MAG: hypothetical protein ACRDG7_03600 [Candidatus Limnocylindria bacterium]